MTSNLLCTVLLNESIPCLRRCKRSGFWSSHTPLSAEDNAYGAVDVTACVNVLYGTLLKLYNLGAKTPTFVCRTVLTKRWVEHAFSEHICVWRVSEKAQQS